jgi:uncharacterized phage protein gp47/JayE
MADNFGLSVAGFKPKDFSIIKSQIEDELRKEVDPSLHFGPGTVAGVISGIVSYQTRQVWEALSGLYHSLQPDSSSGRALDALCSLTGSYRRRATYSKAKATLKLAPDTTIPAHSRIMTVAGDFFKTMHEVKNSSKLELDYEMDIIAESSGPVHAPADSLATIMTPVSGWSKAFVLNTYELGRNDESDEELRLRRIRELKASGSSTRDAIFSRLQNLDGVEALHIKEHEHSFEVVILGGDESEIAQTIWNTKPLGVKSEGTSSKIIKDIIKQERVVKFSRPKQIALSLHATIKVRRLTDGNALKSTLTDFARKNFKLGGEVYSSRFFASILAHSDVLDVITLQLRNRSSGNLTLSQIQEDEIASLSFKDIFIEQIVESI